MTHENNSLNIQNLKCNPTFPPPMSLHLGNNIPIPLGVLTDSYKASHFLQYPPSIEMVAYGEFRRSYLKDDTDQRIAFFGLQYIVENYLNSKWSLEDVELAEAFYSTHNVAGNKFPFPKELFLKFIKENNGYFPVKIEALPEGSAVYIKTPVYQITAEGEYSTLLTFLETLITQSWYPCSVATTSRRIRDLVQSAFDKSVDPESHFLVESRLHDFGFRGVSSVESSILGGVAHLLNFRGSDTLSACYYAQMHLNKGIEIIKNTTLTPEEKQTALKEAHVGESIAATEHSVMTAWNTEEEAIENMFKRFGDDILIATVLDSYHYENAIYNIAPKIKSLKMTLAPNLTWVWRPDSGDPLVSVLQGLFAQSEIFGYTINSKGYKVNNNCAVIQGDGIDIHDVKRILAAVMATGFAASNVAFGMGSGLLQRINRDTASFATKLCFIKYAPSYMDGMSRDVMKTPKHDSTKFSLPGKLKVERVNGIPITMSADETMGGENMLRVVYDKGPVPNAFPETFNEVRKRFCKDWESLPRVRPDFGPKLQTKIQDAIQANTERVSSFGQPGLKILNVPPKIVGEDLTSTSNKS